jgi:hypothetical protein
MNTFMKHFLKTKADTYTVDANTANSEKRTWLEMNFQRKRTWLEMNFGCICAQN